MGQWLNFLGAWAFDPLVDAALITSAASYAWAARVVNRQTPIAPWPGRSSVYFQSGIIILWVMLEGPIGVFDDTFFWAHMVQHIALVMICAPLLLLGNPVLLALRVCSPAVRRRWVVPVLRGSVIRALTGPVTTWVLLALVITGTHFTPFFELTLEHPALHRFVEHPLYLGAALLYFYPLLPGKGAARRLPPAGRVLSMFLMMVPEAMTGFFIYASGYVMYPYYSHVVRPFGPSALTDQQMGGALMWGGSMLIDTGWMALAAYEWLLSEARQGRRVNAALAQELRVSRHA